MYETYNGIKTRNVTTGIPQGSGVFNHEVPKDVNIVGFADDISVLDNQCGA